MERRTHADRAESLGPRRRRIEFREEVQNHIYKKTKRTYQRDKGSKKFNQTVHSGIYTMYEWYYIDLSVSELRVPYSTHVNSQNMMDRRAPMMSECTSCCIWLESVHLAIALVFAPQMRQAARTNLNLSSLEVCTFTSPATPSTKLIVM